MTDACRRARPAVGERAIGLWMPWGLAPGRSAAIAALHIVSRSSPFALFPHECFAFFPFGLTLLGQYIRKNVVLLGAIVLLATQRSATEHPVTPPASMLLAHARLVAPIVAFFDDTQSEPWSSAP